MNLTPFSLQRNSDPPSRRQNFPLTPFSFKQHPRLVRAFQAKHAVRACQLNTPRTLSEIVPDTIFALTFFFASSRRFPTEASGSARLLHDSWESRYANRQGHWNGRALFEINI